MKFKLLLFLIISITSSFHAIAIKDWEAHWITYPKLEPGAYAVLHFRNVFDLSEVPDQLPISISADIRYKLYVNGGYIGQGPANNDLMHYVYDEHEISKHLKPGRNVIAVTVFSFSDLNPLRYESSGAKFIAQAPSEWGDLLNTGSGNWLTSRNNAYSPTLRGKDFEVLSYLAMGGGEKIDGQAYPWGWSELNFDASAWKRPAVSGQGKTYGYTNGYGEAAVSLQPRTIPYMDEGAESRPLMRDNGEKKQIDVYKAWKNREPVQIAANQEVMLLLDQRYLTKGHPFFTFSGGKKAEVKISYAETLFIDVESHHQGHRDSVAGKKFIGISDIYILDGGKNREFSTLIPRVWRYIQVHIKTEDEPLLWNSFRSTKFIYPFKENASFRSNQPIHNDIWDVGWRTARLCADETYMDCPYYEQLQYVGDTRVQALISLYVSGDARLAKNAVTQFAHSITDEGITQSRFPSSLPQYIPPYSLFWVNMIYDLHMHNNDDQFTAQYLDKVASVLFWFEKKLREDKLLGPMPWWSYVDVVQGWPKSSPPGSWEGGSIMLTLQYVYALQDAITLFEYHKKDTIAQYFKNLKKEIQQAIIDKSFNQERGIFADTPDQNAFSQHTNSMAILTNTAPPDQQRSIFEKIINDASVSKTNIYFTFYLHRAAQKVGSGSYFLQNLDIWQNMLKDGLSTFAETVQQTRSDCHAWSASPNYEFLSIVCGIQPAAPHFQAIRITPSPGTLRNISGKMPHPKGYIAVDFNFKGNSVSGEIVIPEGATASFHWRGKELALKSGKNKINL